MRIKGPGLGGGGAPGTDGLSAYQIAVANGFVGTQLEWLESLNGADGINGDDGTNGASAYMIALVEGYVGTQAEWIASLNGADGTDGSNGIDGTDGVDGLSAYELALAGGFVGTEAAWLASLVGMPGNDGNDGIDGTDGTNGVDGDDGTNGASAYMVAVANGYVGTEPDWLLTLVGADGTNGTNGTNGTDGVDGTDGADGDSAYEVAVNNGFVGSEAAWLASLVGADGTDGVDGTDGATGGGPTFIPIAGAIFNGATATIQSQFGGTLTRTATGRFTFVFTVPRTDDAYHVVGLSGRDILADAGGLSLVAISVIEKTATQFRFNTTYANGNVFNGEESSFLVFPKEVSPPTPLPPIGITSIAGNYTVLGTESYTIFDDATAQIITLPTAAATGFQFSGHRGGVGTVTFAADVGAVIRSPTGMLALRERYSAFTLTKISATEWAIAGDLI